MLQMAPTTCFKVGTLWFYPRRTLLMDTNQFSGCKVFLFRKDIDLNLIIRSCKWNEDDEAFMTQNALAAKSDRFNFSFNHFYAARIFASGSSADDLEITDLQLNARFI